MNRAISQPAVQVALAPIRTYHCQETAVKKWTLSITVAPVPIAANAVLGRRYPAIPRRKIPRTKPLVKELMPSTSSTTRPENCMAAIATMICRTPQTTVD